MDDLTEIREFLACDTPQEWLNCAVDHLPLLLIDHANCEKKAASSALNLMYRYISYPELLRAMSRLAREELRHFEQVLQLMLARKIEYQHVSPSRYAGGMRQDIRTHEPERLVDTLIVGAFIEARSCERFGALVPLLDEQLSAFYSSLLRSEARHFQNYLYLAGQFSEDPIDERIAHFRECEAALIVSPDHEFRFHSGVPSA